jgi:hypothetical protein
MKKLLPLLLILIFANFAFGQDNPYIQPSIGKAKTTSPEDSIAKLFIFPKVSSDAWIGKRFLVAPSPRNVGY